MGMILKFRYWIEQRRERESDEPIEGQIIFFILPALIGFNELGLVFLCICEPGMIQ